MLGLKKGTNPECPACTLAKSRKINLESTPNARSARAHYRVEQSIYQCRCEFQVDQLRCFEVVQGALFNQLTQTSMGWPNRPGQSIWRVHLHPNTTPWRACQSWYTTLLVHSTPQRGALRFRLITCQERHTLVSVVDSEILEKWFSNEHKETEISNTCPERHTFVSVVDSDILEKTS